MMVRHAWSSRVVSLISYPILLLQLVLVLLVMNTRSRGLHQRDLADRLNVRLERLYGHTRRQLRLMLGEIYKLLMFLLHGDHSCGCGCSRGRRGHVAGAITRRSGGTCIHRLPRSIVDIW